MRVCCVGQNPNQIKEKRMAIHKVHLAGTKGKGIGSRLYLAFMSYRLAVNGPSLFTDHGSRSVESKSISWSGWGNVQGNREKSRRLRQREKGMLHF